MPAREQATVLSAAGNAYLLIRSRRRGGTASSRSQRGKPSSHQGIQPVSQPGRGSADSGLRGYPVKAESRKQKAESGIIATLLKFPSSCFIICLLVSAEIASIVVCCLLTVVIYFCYLFMFLFLFFLMFLFLALALLFLLLTLILAPNAWRLSTGSQWGTGSSHHARRHRGEQPPVDNGVRTADNAHQQTVLARETSTTAECRVSPQRLSEPTTGINPPSPLPLRPTAREERSSLHRHCRVTTGRCTPRRENNAALLATTHLRNYQFIKQIN